MKIEFNSHNVFYKEPFGSVTTGEKVRFRLLVENGGIPNCVKLISIFRDIKTEYDMSYIFTLQNSSCYEVTIDMPNVVGHFWYYFKVFAQGGKKYYFNNDNSYGGIGKEKESEIGNYYQITVFDKSYKTPEWFKKSVFYQIFPDRFYCKNDLRDKRSDIIKRNWGEIPYYKKEQFGTEYSANDFFGGNICGIVEKLDYLEELGITGIYLNPIFKAFSNHKYDTTDYMQIDETFGVADDFSKLSKECKKRGIRIILDGVFNHTGSESIYFDKNNKFKNGAYNNRDTQYREWYKINDDNSYETWWGFLTLPKCNQESKGFRNFIYGDKNSVVKTWIKNGASGFRLDVADELSDEFISGIKSAIKEANKDSVLIGEVWEDASNKISYGIRKEYFLGFELDSVMNYPLKNALIDIALNRIGAKEFTFRIMSLFENYPKESFYACLNILSSHDSMRILTALSNPKLDLSKDEKANYKLSKNEYQKAKEKLKLILAFIMTFPGVPCIYYGDEVGMQGYEDPFSRGCFPWGNEDFDLLEYTKKMIKLRKDNECLSIGDFEIVYANEFVICYIRKNQDDFYLICINFGSEKVVSRIDLGRFCIDRIADIENFDEFYDEKGIFLIDLLPNEIKILKNSKK